MAHRKAGGSARNLTDSKPKYLGVKLFAGEKAKTGSVIVRQRGSRIEAGKNVGMGTDHTLFALAEGKVAYRSARKKSFKGKDQQKKIVDVL